MYTTAIISLLMVSIVVGLFYIFHKKLPIEYSTVNVYLTVLFSFMVMQMMIHAVFLLVQTTMPDHFLLLKESAVFTQDMVKLVVGGLLGALLPVQNKNEKL